MIADPRIARLCACTLWLLAACSGDDDPQRGESPAGSDGSAGDAGAAGRAGSAAGAGSGGSAGRANTGGSGRGGADGARAGASGGSAGSGADAERSAIGGCTLFSADDAWNRDIANEPVDATWTERLQQLVGDIRIHPDYGNSGDEHYGIPINVVPATQAAVPIEFSDYPEESDPGPYPLPDPDDAKIEGGTTSECDGDCHLLVVQQGSCMLYEGYACAYDGGYRCANGAVWDLSQNSYGQRTKGWTSADAAGLAITPGLVRYDEVQAGEVNHAIRFTVRCTRNRYVAPATHYAVPGSCDANDENAPPMGLRVRLRADYDLGELSESARVVARAMQRYGMILADNGSNFYFQGEDNPGWSEEDVEPLKSIPASAFEVIAPPPLEP
jgi:hypothetical protein